MWPPRFETPLNHPLRSVATIEWDHSTGMATVKGLDGTTLTDEVGVIESGVLSATIFDVRDSVIRAPTHLGPVLEFDITSADANPPVPTIYLDQNHWIELARAEGGDERVPIAARSAYLRLSELAASHAIVMPLSAAHLVETARRSGRQRQDVALTMLTHSRGWQFRGPLEVRRAEIYGMFSAHRWKSGNGDAPATLSLVSLEPDAIWNDAANRTAVSFVNSGDLGPVERELSERMSWICSLAETLLDPARESSFEGEQAATQWARSMQELAEHMASNPEAKALRRELTRARMIGDLQTELAAGALASGMSQADFGTWLADDVEESFATSPALGRLREVMHERIINADDRWERNDLNDLMYLCTAAGYVDVVLGERKTSNYLNRVSGRVVPGAEVTYRVGDALAAIESLLDDQAPHPS